MYQKAINLIKKHPKKLLIILAVLFAIIYSYLPSVVFNSPDENANYFFSELFATETRLNYPITEDSDVLHPRSMLVINQNIVPISFLGMPLLYGSLAKIFTANAIPFFTPIIAVISVLFFYEIIKKVFSPKIALISSIILFIHPAFWYYATRSMYHNMLFICLIIIGLYFLLLKKSYQNIILASIFIGLALIVRTSEAPWVILSLIILYLFNRKKLSYKKITTSIFVLIIVLLPILYLNNNIYGHPLSTGYKLLNTTSDIIVQQSTNSGEVIKLNNVIKNFWNYGVYIFWWLSIPMYLGLAWFLKNFKKLDHKKKQYLIIFLVSTGYLITYYGNWVFNDNPDPTKITIGTSYIRYWLPIYIFSTPFIAKTLLTIKNFNFKYKIIASTITAILLGYNLIFTFSLADESLQKTKQTLIEYATIKTKVLNITKPKSIIIAGYYDKLFFPNRLIIENLNEERDKRLNEISKLLNKDYPVYYYSWQNDQDIQYLNKKILNKYNLKLTNPIIIREGERLFKLTAN